MNFRFCKSLSRNEVFSLASVALIFTACHPNSPKLTLETQAPSPQVYTEAKPQPPPTKPTAAPTAAPIARFPETDSDVAAVAFEDMSPSRNDQDFNDFLTDFKIYEKINAQNQVTNIVVDFYPRAVGASYDHEFLMVLNGVKDSPTDVKTPKTAALVHGPTDVEVTYYAGTGPTPLGPATKMSADHDVVIFPSTHALFNSNAKSQDIFNTNPSKPYVTTSQRARLSITLLDPTQNVIDPSNPIDISHFRMMLHVKNTNRDIDIIDVDSTNFDKNKSDGLYYPFGFIIPANWHWPNEGVSINKAYPSFQAYNDYLRARVDNPTLVPTPDVAKWYDAPPVMSDVYTDQGKPVPEPELLPDPW